MHALSQTPFASQLLEGPLTDGISLGHGHLLFADVVLSLTRPGALRMPNGIECGLPEPERGAPVRVGGRRLQSDVGVLCPGTHWDPKPCPRYAVVTQPDIASWSLRSLAGRGPGLTPLGDDILTGYLAARALFGRSSCSSLADSLARRTTSLSATLLRLAARGEVPEAAHHLLERGNPAPLLTWGATSGSGLLTGLGLYRAPGPAGTQRALEFELPLEPSRVVGVKIGPLPGLTVLEQPEFEMPYRCICPG